MEKYYGIIALIILLIVLVIFIKYQTNKEEELEQDTEPTKVRTIEASPLDTSDEDALVASLIASIECRTETNKNVQVIRVRKVN